MFCNSNCKVSTKLDKIPVSGCLEATKDNCVAMDSELLGAYKTLSAMGLKKGF